MESPALTRITVLGVPLDILPPEAIDEVVASFEDGRNHQIVLLSLRDLLRARRKGEYRSMVQGASLVLPISRSIIRGAKFLHRPEPVRYMPFDFAVKLLGALERRGRSVYLLGAGRISLQKAEANVKSTFPGLRVVGRYAGRYPKAMEGAIVAAVRKATPTLLLVGQGVPGRERWIPRNLPRFDAGIHLWCSDLFEILAGRRHRVSRTLFDRGLEWVPLLARRPWRILRFPGYLWWLVLLLVARLRRR